MGRLKVLIADDAETMRKMYEITLPEELFELHMASDGQQAMNLFEELKPDIMLLDVVMPVKTGFTVLKEIRDMHPPLKPGATEKGTVILMATSMDSKNDIMDCVRLGINGYLVKPINRQTISERLISEYQKIYPDYQPPAG